MIGLGVDNLLDTVRREESSGVVEAMVECVHADVLADKRFVALALWEAGYRTRY